MFLSLSPLRGQSWRQRAAAVAASRGVLGAGAGELLLGLELPFAPLFPPPLPRRGTGRGQEGKDQK